MRQHASTPQHTLLSLRTAVMRHVIVRGPSRSKKQSSHPDLQAIEGLYSPLGRTSSVDQDFERVQGLGVEEASLETARIDSTIKTRDRKSFLLALIQCRPLFKSYNRNLSSVIGRSRTRFPVAW